MTNQNPHLKILITGCYPPPYGGGAVYIQRLFSYLTGKGHLCHIFDACTPQDGDLPEGVFKIETKLQMYWRILTSRKYDILHINESMWKHRAILIFIAKIKRMQSVLTLHSFRDTPETTDRVNRFMMGYALKNVNCIVSSGNKEVMLLRQWFPDTKRTKVITPFIAPDTEVAGQPLPEAIASFLATRGTVISANGSNLGFFRGEDIYGLDLLVELCHRLQSWGDVSVVYCLTRVTDADYMQKIQDRIAAYNLSDRFLIYTGTVEFWRVIAESALFIRPTRDDSFGISVAEAILLQKPAIVSDVCERPRGSILFRTGDLEDLLEKTLRVLHAPPDQRDRASGFYLADGATATEALYYDILTHENDMRAPIEGINE